MKAKAHTPESIPEGAESLWTTRPSARSDELPLDIDVTVESIRVVAAMNADDASARAFSTALDAETLRHTLVD